LKELVAERDTGFGKLSSAVEAGEKLYPNTAAEGREVIRHELRALKLGWESLFDDLSSVQRKMEVALVQWTSFDDSYGQVEHWLRDMESHLEGQTPLRSTLEEKKSQLQGYKVSTSCQYLKVIKTVTSIIDCKEI
jgi:nesprin-1